MKRMMSITTLCLASLLPAVANAEEGNLNRSVRGDYAFSGDAACIGSINGFHGLHAAAPAYIASFSAEGVRRFNGDGTGTVSGRAIGFALGPYNNANGYLIPGATTVSTFSGPFTYMVALDRSIHIDQTSLTSIQTVGPVAGISGADTEVWTGIKVDGHVSQDFKTITVATAAPDPRNTTSPLALEFGVIGNALPGQGPDTRACHRSRVMVRIGDRRDRDD